jgi:secreted Zn-dependent insulinase-like peptidase
MVQRFFSMPCSQVDLVWCVRGGLGADIRCKPWRWVSHLLGHEAVGSVAYQLKREGLIQVGRAKPDRARLFLD